METETSRSFEISDQNKFAGFSGDYNPIHLNGVFARRLLGGKLVVHGVGVLLWGLECLVSRQNKKCCFEAIKGRFLKPILIGDQVQIFISKKSENVFFISLEVLGDVAIEIEVVFCSRQNIILDRFINGLPSRAESDLIETKQIKHIAGEVDLYLPLKEAESFFPAMTRFSPHQQFAAILATSRIIGMKCPGLYSRYSSMELCFDCSVTSSLEMTYDVKTFDERFNIVCLDVTTGGVRGCLTAFLVPAPQEQSKYSLAALSVKDGEFQGQRALIIGGSRGLGEITAKLLCAGGSDVVITYNAGADDALRVISELTANERPARFVKYDAVDKEAKVTKSLEKDWIPTHVYYFPTPVIFSAKNGEFSNPLFFEFCQYYVAGFLKVFQELHEKGVRCFFYPSSVAIDEKPANMGEYIAAKLAGESMCGFLERANKGVRIYKPRLPRLPTDQTASITPFKTQNAADVMLDHLRLFKNPDEF